MANVFKPKRSSTASSVPTTSNLADGELAVNSADQKIYLREGSNIVEVGNTSGGDAETLGGISSTSFLRSDEVSTKTSGALKFNDTVHARFGTNGDLRIYHSGTASFIEQNGAATGPLNIRQAIDDADVVIQSDDGSGGTTQYVRADGSSGEAVLYHYGSEKLATKSNGIDVTGHTETDTLNVSGVSTFTGDVSFGSTATFGDFDKLNFGDGNDLQIFHNPNNGNSVISEFGSGNLHINADHLQIKNSGATELKAKFLTNGAVELYHDNSKKFETVGTGVSVTGNISVGSTTNIIRKVTDINSWVAVDADTSFSVTNQQNAPTGLYFKSDGTKMFVTGTQSPRDVEEYALSTAWDITTASHTTGYSINSQDTGPQGLYFSPNGENMFVAGNSSDSILHYTLSTGWDLTSTVSYVGNFSVSSQDTIPTAVTFGDNGTKMYVTGRTNDSINQYNLSSAYTITSGVTHAHTLDIGQESSIIGTPNGFANPHGISISSDGTKIWVIGPNEDIISQFNLGTAYDLSTATYNGDLTNIFWASNTAYDLYIDESAEKGFVLFSGGSDDCVRGIDIATSGLLIEANPTVRSANINLNNNVQVKGRTWFEDAIVVNGSQSSYFNHHLQIQGTLTCRGPIDIGDGPSDRIQFGGSDDAKIYYDATANYFDLQFSTADNNGFRILDNSSSELFRVAKDGNVGIGTDSPTAKLDVRGGINISGVATASSFTGNLTGTASTATTVAVTLDSTTGSAYKIPYLNTTSNSSGNYELLLESGTFTYQPSNNTLTVNGISVAQIFVSDYISLSDDDVIRIGSSNDAKVFYDGTANDLEIELEASANKIAITDNGTYKHLITRDGKVGINTSVTPTVELDVNGNVNITGVSTFQSHVKLGDNSNLKIGAGDDLEFYHNSITNESIIKETGGSNFLIQGTNLHLQSASGENYFVGTLDGSAELYYDNSKKFETTNTGVTITGTASATEFSGGGSNLTGLTGASAATYGDSGSTPVITVDSNGRITGITTAAVSGGGGGGISDIVEDTTPQLGGNLSSNGKNINFGDSASASDDRLNFGAGTDLSIYFDGTDSYIDVNPDATNNLYIRNNVGSDESGNIYIQAKSGENSIVCNDDASVVLYHNDAQKFTTTTTGFTVTGTGLGNFKANDNSTLTAGTGDDFQIHHDGTDTYLDNDTGSLYIRANVGGDVNGDIYIQAKSGENSIACFDDSSVRLYFDNVQRFTTTSTGISVSGTGLGNWKANDSAYITAGTDDDFQIYHDGTDTYLDNDTGSLYIRSNVASDVNGDIYIQAKSGENSIVCFDDSSVRLYFDNVQRLTTTNTGVTISGTLSVTTLAFSDDQTMTFGASDDLSIYHNGTDNNSYIDNDTGDFYIRNNVGGDVGGDIHIQAKSGENSIVCYDDSSVRLYFDNAQKFTTTSTGISVSGTGLGNWKANDSAYITAGTDDDLQIYHDGTDTYFDNDTGSVYIRNNVASDVNGDIYIQAKSGENSIVCYDDSSVRLYFDNAQKFTTTSTGISVSGTGVGDGWKVGDSEYFTAGTGDDFQIYHDGTDTYLDNDTGHLYIRNNVAGDVGGNIYLMPHDNENGIVIHDDGEVRIYYNNAEKLNTSSTGVTVTGELTATTIVKSSNSGGFLKADGTEDTSTYLTSYTETDPVVAAINGIVKSNGTTISAATAGHDYLAPSGDGSSLTGVLSDVVEDTTPQLGGNLDLNSKTINGTGTINITGIATATNIVSVKSDDGTPGRVDLYCETNNAHYARIQAPAHADFSGNITLTLPNSTGTLLNSDGSGANLTALNASNLGSGTVPDARFPSTLPAVSGASLTGLTGASSGTYGDASNVAQIVVDANGRITGITEVAISGGGGGGGASEAFKTISVSGQSDVVADSATDTLTLVAGSNMTITTNASGDSITFASSGGGGGGGGITRAQSMISAMVFS